MPVTINDLNGRADNVDSFLLFQRQLEQGCTNPIPCANDGQAVACPAGCPSTDCIQYQRTCNKCAYATCNSSTSSGGGVNPGVIAGPIIGVVLLLASLGLFWWLRRKKQRDLARLEDLANRARKGESSAFHLSQPSSPITSSHRHRSGQLNPKSPTSSSQGTGTSSQRLPNATAEGQYRDVDGNIIRVYTGKRGAINADPNHPDNGGAGDPFGDQNSLQTDRADSGHSTNVVPIHYVPGTAAEAMAMRNGQNANPMQQAAAARTLDQARQNLWKPRMPPQRPARAPDLDLRLNSQNQNGQRVMQEVPHNESRDSFVSALSTAPSYMSGATADLHLDVPKIMTRQQVHVGRLQAAEVVQFGARNVVPEESGPATTSDGVNPFTERSTELLDTTLASGQGSLNTFGASSSNEPHSGGAAAASVTSLGSRRFDDEGDMSQPSPTDLRFSMGSLAYDRASVSTVGTTSHSHRGQFLAPPDQPPVPSLPANYSRPRYESVSSYKSTGNDSLLGSFPMIPPAAGSQTNLTQQGGAAPPPVSFKGPAPQSGRPLTATSAHSVADSFLGRFPFVPPNVDADGGSLNQQQPGASASRLTLGSVSEGLGLNDFHFEFEHPPVPTVPSQYAEGHDEEKK